MIKKFKTSVSAYIYDDTRDDITAENFNLYWTLELEVREYGIKSTIISVQSIRGDIFWKEAYPTDDRDGFDVRDMEEELEINLLASDEWTVDTDSVEWSDWGTIAPEDIDIDFNKKTIQVS